MDTEFIHFTGANGISLPGRIWMPEYSPCMVVQITHGMTEHIGRYEALAEKLTAYGIVVAGFDLRGHGLNKDCTSCATLDQDGWKASLHDMYLFYLELESRFPKLPHFMLGFSLGSFLLRDYLSHYRKKPDGAIILGTGHQPWFILSPLMRVVKKEIRISGFDNSSALVNKLSFESYNQKFPQNMGYFSWLCSDPDELSRYSSDKLCCRYISAGLFYQLLDSMKHTSTHKSYKKWDKKMPVLLMSGNDDPVGDFGKGVRRVKADMDKAGMKDVELFLLADARHDLFHENRNGRADEAIDNLINWLFEKI